MKTQRFLRCVGEVAIAALMVTAVVGTASVAGASTPSPHTAVTSQTITDTSGNVYYQAPPPRLVPSPTSDPADLVSASATDTGSNLVFTAKTVALNNPQTDPNWRHNTYISWGIDPSPSTTPQYFVIFEVNSAGVFDGELAYAGFEGQVSCTVTLSFNASSGYEAQVPTACLPGVDSFRWNAYSLYDTVAQSVDPNGSHGFGKALPDVHDGGSSSAGPVSAPPTSSTGPVDGVKPGYWLFARDGGVFSFGSAKFLGSEGGVHLNQPVVGGAATLDGHGYWLVASDGGIFAFGDARFYGSTGADHLNSPIVGIIPTPSGAGYWLVASDGGIFAFGNAKFNGSTGGERLNSPIVGGASTTDGKGYWLVGADGGIFAYGDAKFAGSEGGAHLNAPIVGMSAAGSGYRLVASDGGIFAFGGAPYFGSTGALHLAKPIVGIADNARDDGYRLVASDGGIFSFGNATFLGSEGGQPLSQPIVAMASVG